MIRYALTIRPCHSHQLACHLRSPVTATPIIASDSRRKQAMTAAGSSLRPLAEEAPVARGADRVDERADDRQHASAGCRARPRCSAPSSGGRLATVQTNHPTIASSTNARSSAVGAGSATGANAGPEVDERRARPRTPRSRSSPTGIATWKPACSCVKRTPVVPIACSPMKPPVAMNASESSRTRASPRRLAASPAA